MIRFAVWIAVRRATRHYWLRAVIVPVQLPRWENILWT